MYKYKKMFPLRMLINATIYRKFIVKLDYSIQFRTSEHGLFLVALACSCSCS
jgi:hypothetical protein